MYLGCRVKIPNEGKKVSVKTISGTPYVYYEYGRTYSKEKKYTIPKRTCIGKQDKGQIIFIRKLPVAGNGVFAYADNGNIAIFELGIVFPEGTCLPGAAGGVVFGVKVKYHFFACKIT